MTNDVEVLDGIDSISLESATKLADLLKAIGNNRRLQILSTIIMAGEISVKEIDQAIPDLNQSPISQHLSRLREQGIIKCRKVRQSRLYKISSPETQDLLETLIFSLSASDASLREECDIFTGKTNGEIRNVG